MVAYYGSIEDIESADGHPRARASRRCGVRENDARVYGAPLLSAAGVRRCEVAVDMGDANALAASV